MNKELFQLYEDMYNLHVGTKTNDTVFHNASAAFYETLFDVVHGVDESMQDSKQESPVDPKIARKSAYEIVEKAKSIVEGLVNSNKDIAVDNVLRGLVDKLGFECGNARALCPCNDKEVKEETVEKKETEEAPEPKAESDEEEGMEDDMKEEAETSEETEDEYEEDLVGESMKGQESGYKTSIKEDKPSSREDELNKKRKGSTDYTVVSIMP